jgi:hypothetical protein
MSDVVIPEVSEDSGGLFEDLFKGDDAEEEERFGKSLLPYNFCWTWPQSIWSWMFWGLGCLSMGYGLITSLAAFQIDGFPLVIIGLVIMGFASPNPFALMLKKCVPDASDNWSIDPMPPMNSSQWHLDRPVWNEKFGEWLPDPLSRFEMDGPEISFKKIGKQWAVYYDGQEVGCDDCGGSGKVDGQKCEMCAGEELLFDSESEVSAQMKKLLRRRDMLNAQEMIFAEHPRHYRHRRLFNTTPPMITSRLFFHAFAVMFIMGMFLGFPSEDREGAAPFAMALVVFGVLGSIASQWVNKGVIEAWDTVTSIVKYLDEGHTELVGQVRPATLVPPPIVHVDGCRDDDWTFRGLVAWSWTYRVYKCVKERYYDSQSETWKTRTVCNWEYIRGDSHVDERFMLHDGTGGVFVDLESFEDNMHIGDTIWRREKRGKVGGNPLYTDGDVRRHEWYLRALGFGDPVYVMARIKSMPPDDIPRGVIAENASRIHHTMYAVGEDAVRRTAKLRKGTEFSVLKPKTSFLSRMGALIMLVLAGMVMIAIS